MTLCPMKISMTDLFCSPKPTLLCFLKQPLFLLKKKMLTKRTPRQATPNRYCLVYRHRIFECWIDLHNVDTDK